jgi:hypothetical protein
MVSPHTLLFLFNTLFSLLIASIAELYGKSLTETGFREVLDTFKEGEEESMLGEGVTEREKEGE